jgi:hypothetical protein
MKEIDVVPSMLDLIEKTNGEICMLMGLAFAMGVMVAVTLMCIWVQSLQSKLRNTQVDLIATQQRASLLVRRLEQKGMYHDVKGAS